MYAKERIKNHFLNLLQDKQLAMVYFYGRDIVEEFHKDRLTELEKKVKKSEKRYNMFLNLDLSNYLGIENLAKKTTTKLIKAQRTYYKNMSELNVFKANLAYLIISGILKLENAQVMGYSREFIAEFLIPYKKQSENPYNEYYYNENNGRTTLIDKKSFNMILPYTPDIILKRISEERTESYINSRTSSLKRLSRR